MSVKETDREIVAVIIALYINDRLDWIQEAIESITRQSYGCHNIRIYLGVDGKLREDVEKYIFSNKKLFYKILKNNNNRGLAFTLNKLIRSLEDEKYIFRMDSDDISTNDRFERQIAFMEENPQVHILGSDIIEIDSNGSEIGRRKYPRTDNDVRRNIHKGSPLAHPAVCFRKNVFETIPEYPDIKFNEDIALWFLCLKHGIQIANINNELLLYRITRNTYYRRGWEKAFTEYKVYHNGLLALYGYNWKMIFPLLRLIFRISPPKIVRYFYRSKLRHSVLFKQKAM